MYSPTRPLSRRISRATNWTSGPTQCETAMLLKPFIRSCIVIALATINACGVQSALGDDGVIVRKPIKLAPPAQSGSEQNGQIANPSVPASRDAEVTTPSVRPREPDILLDPGPRRGSIPDILVTPQPRTRTTIDADPPSTVEQIPANGVQFHIKAPQNQKVQVEFFSQRRAISWPGAGEAYVLNPNEEGHFKLACEPGEKICYGAWSVPSSVFWGAGRRGEDACSDCCTVCGRNFSMNLRIRPSETQVAKDHPEDSVPFADETEPSEKRSACYAKRTDRCIKTQFNTNDVCNGMLEGQDRLDCVHEAGAASGRCLEQAKQDCHYGSAQYPR
jgi:hypothetical protein